MKIIVTGGLGHIGSRLIRKLPEEIPGAEIIIFDNLQVQRYCSVFHLPENGVYRFVQGDILLDDLEEAFKGADVVVNLAANTEPEQSVEKEAEVEAVNYTGTIRVAECCAKLGIMLFFPSSTSVYGSPDKIIDEQTPVTAESAQSPYAKTKVKSEEYLKKLGEEKGLQYVVCRFGTIFGISPGMRFHTAVNKFTWQACNSQPLTVWETAYEQRRPYLDIEDAVSAICFFIKNQKFDNEIYNVVTLNAAVKDIVGEIKKHIPNVKIQFVKSKIMNALSYDVSSEKIEKLGFRAQGSFARGVRDTVELLSGLWQQGSECGDSKDESM